MNSLDACKTQIITLFITSMPSLVYLFLLNVLNTDILRDWSWEFNLKKTNVEFRIRRIICIFLDTIVARSNTKSILKASFEWRFCFRSSFCTYVDAKMLPSTFQWLDSIKHLTLFSNPVFKLYETLDVWHFAAVVVSCLPRNSPALKIN